MAKYISVALLLILINSCNKNDSAAIPDCKVSVRIQNSTSITLGNAELYYDRTHHNYGNITPGGSTDYFLLDSILQTPALIFDSAETKKVAGYVFFSEGLPGPYLTPGNYTLKIFPNLYSSYHYDAVYIKD